MKVEPPTFHWRSLMKSKSSLSLLSLLLCASATAAEGERASIDEINRKIDELSMESVWGTKGAKTAPAIPNPSGRGAYLYGDWLYWRTYENGVFNFTACRTDTIFGIQKPDAISDYDADPIDENTTTCSQIKLEDVKFDFDSGFRLGIGYASPCYEYWDLRAEYTQFTNEANRSDCFDCPCPRLCLPTLCPGDPYSPDVGAAGFTAQNTVLSCSSWEIDYYNLDVTLGRFYFLSKMFAVRPHWGGRASWINQTKNINLSTAGQGVAGQIEAGGADFGRIFAIDQRDSVLCIDGAENDFWGVGPLVGLEGKWFLTQNLSLYTEASGSLLFGKFDIEEQICLSQSSIDTTFLPEGIYDDLGHSDFKNCITQCFCYNPFEIVPSARLSVGVGFDYPFQDEKYSISLRIGYDVEYYWRQNYLGSPVAVLAPDIKDFDPFAILAGLFGAPGPIGPSEEDITASAAFAAPAIPASLLNFFILPAEGFVNDNQQPIVMPNSPGDLAFHGLTLGARLGF